MTSSFDWYEDPNPLRVAGTLYKKLLPALAVAGGACMVGVIVAALATDPHGNCGVGEAIIGVIVYGLTGAVFSAMAGFFASIFISLVDASFCRILSPISYGAACVALSVIPIAIMGIFQQAFSTYPSGNAFVYFYYVPIIFVGCVAGIWGASRNIPARPNADSKRIRYSSRQLMSLTFWIALVFGFGNVVFLIAAAIYIAIVVVTVFVYSILSHFRS